MRHADILLRLSVAFAFLYPPINALFDPYSWTGYFPPLLLDSGISETVLLHTFGLIEVALALWILFGKRIFWPSLAAAAGLVAIVVMNLGDFQVLFRDFSIALAAFALAFMHRPGAGEGQ